MTDTVIFEIRASAKGVKVVQKQTDELAKSTDRADKSTKKLDKSRDTYNRREKGAAQISTNATKNFSKMQQGIDGGGGGGGLVRAYALLAANVFALTAAFGVLSRSAQIDTLVQSMEILSTTGGTYIKNLAKDMQEASGYAVDLAQSFAQVSLASSAGLNTKEIEGLTKVAKGAAISLGRNLPDAMDRIFRGAIKLEPEILDEIGLFVRVDEAAQKYARNNNKVVSALTQVEKRQAFLNEILEQGTTKFSAYADEIKPDPYVRLGAALGDIAQGGLSLVNSVLGPLLGFLAESKVLLTLVFGALVTVLLKKAIPAMGLMTKGAAELAQERADAAKEYSEGISANAKQAIAAEEKVLTAKRKSLKDDAKNQKRFVSRSKKPGADTTALDKAKLGSKNRAVKVEERILVLQKAQLKAKGQNKVLIDQELAALEKEKQIEQELTSLRSTTGVAPGQLADMRQKKLDSKARVQTVVATSAGTMETQGISAGWKELNKTLKKGEQQADGTFKKFTQGEKAAARLKGGVSALGVGFNRLMMMMGPVMMILGLLSPLLIAAAKAMGFGREEAKQWGEELKRASDRSEKLTERIIKQMEVVNNLEATYFQQNKAQLAFNKTMLETIETNEKLVESFRKQQETSTQWTRFVDDYIFGMLSISKATEFDGKKVFSGSEWDMYHAQFQNFFDNAEQAARGTNDYIKGQFKQVPGAEKYMNIIENQVVIEKALADAREESSKAMQEGTLKFGDMSDAMEVARDLQSDDLKTRWMAQDAYKKMSPILQKQINAEVALGSQREKASKALENVSRHTSDWTVATEASHGVLKKETQIIENLDSALTGASESIGKFQQKFMPKTDVDDVLSSFKQMETGFKEILADDKISDKKVDDFFQKFADPDNPFNALFQGLFEVDKDGKRTIKDSEQARKLFYETIHQFEEYQTSVIEAKMQLKALGTEQKRFAKLSSAGIQANTAHQKTSTKIAELNFDMMKKSVDIQLKSFGLDRATNEEMRGKLNTATSLAQKQRIILEYGQDENKIRQANSFLLEEDEKRIEMRIQQATEELRIAKEYTTEQQKLLKVQKELANAKVKLAESEAKLEARAGRGTLAINPREQAKLEIEAAKTKFKFFIQEAEMKRKLLQIESDLLATRIMVLDLEGKFKGTGVDAYEMRKTLKENMKLQSDLIDTQINNAKNAFGITLSEIVTKNFSKGVIHGIRAGQDAAAADLEKFDEKRMQKVASVYYAMRQHFESELGRESTGEERDKIYGFAEQEVDRERASKAAASGLQMFRDTAEKYAETLSKMGPEGELVSSVVRGSIVIADSFHNVGKVFKSTDNAMERGAAVAETVANTFQQIGQIMAANSKAQIAEVDQQIEAEKRRDGKSAESLAKIKALEKKKEMMARKAFEQNKKMQMATVVANTAASIMQVWANPADITKGWAIAMTALIASMGMAQLSIISKSKFNGGAADVSPPSTALNIGKRDNKVDVSRGASGGEMAYMRGARGQGSNANDFRPTGGAYGIRSYAYQGEGILVGEQGPEVVTPTQPVDVLPMTGTGGPQNINFTINAVDAEGVESVLERQQGTIIGMIRNAANGYGGDFLEYVDTDVVGDARGYNKV